jgi:hypothetical protein
MRILFSGLWMSYHNFYWIFSCYLLSTKPVLTHLSTTVVLLTWVGIAQSVQRLATGWTTDGMDIESRQGQECSLLHVVKTSYGTQPASYPMGTGGHGARRPGREADHSLPTSAEVKITWIYQNASTPSTLSWRSTYWRIVATFLYWHVLSSNWS